MRMSASVLGRELRMSGKDVNALLFERGYLYGKPSSYGLTEKGKQYGQETDHQRGTGGWASMNPSWTTRLWDDAILTELARDVSDDNLAPTGGPVQEAPAGVAEAKSNDEDDDAADDFEYIDNYDIYGSPAGSVGRFTRLDGRVGVGSTRRG